MLNEYYNLLLNEYSTVNEKGKAINEFVVNFTKVNPTASRR